MENTSVCTTGRVSNWEDFGLSGVAGLMSEVGVWCTIVIGNFESRFRRVWGYMERFIHIPQV